MHYIETSIGRVEFLSKLNDNCYIADDIEPQNKEIFDKFLDMYDFYEIIIINTVNGWFMKISLNDGHYGIPEYKIYTE